MKLDVILNLAAAALALYVFMRWRAAPKPATNYYAGGMQAPPGYVWDESRQAYVMRNIDGHVTASTDPGYSVYV